MNDVRYLDEVERRLKAIEARLDKLSEFEMWPKDIHTLRGWNEKGELVFELIAGKPGNMKEEK